MFNIQWEWQPRDLIGNYDIFYLDFLTICKYRKLYYNMLFMQRSMHKGYKKLKKKENLDCKSSNVVAASVAFFCKEEMSFQSKKFLVKWKTLMALVEQTNHFNFFSRFGNELCITEKTKKDILKENCVA